MKPRIGLALGGGGARGLAHIGILKVLEEAQIKIDYISGTSMGGIIASLYAMGKSISEMEQAALHFSRIRELMKMIDLTPARRGLLEGTRIRRHLKKLIGQDRNIEDLDIPLLMNAVDLETGKEVLFTQGSLLEAIFATSAVPGIFSPIKRGEQLLVDGGVVNNLPINHLRGMGAEFLIGIDVHIDPTRKNSWQKEHEQEKFHWQMPKFLMDFYRAEMIMIYHMTLQHIEKVKPDVLISPELPEDITIFLGFTRAADIIRTGEESMRKMMPAIIKKIKSW